MRRRALLALAAASLSGCEGPAAETETATESPAVTPGDDARSVRVENATDRDRFVTVVVRDGGRVLASASRELPPGKTGLLADLVSRSGVHDVVVETGGGRRRRGQWVVHEDWPEPYEVTVREGGLELGQTTTCPPACPPLGLTGEATDLSYGPGPRDAPAGGTLLVRNVAPEVRRVAVVVTDADDGRTLLSYRYRVPGTVGFAVPVAGGPGVYPTRVAAGSAERRLRWHVPETTTLRLDVGRGIRSRCPQTTGRTALAVENVDDRSHDVVVRPSVDGERLDERHYRLPAESPLSVADRFEAEQTLELEAVDDTGASLSARWVQCPPAEVRLRVDAVGLLLIRNYVVVAASE